MNNVINILEKLEQTSGRLDKISILQDNKNNEDLKRIFQYAMNPFRIYGIGAKSFKKVQSLFSKDFKDIFELLNFLLKYSTGTDKVKLTMNTWLTKQPELEQKWYKRIILKNLRIGLTATTINKVWKDLIPTFNVQLAEPFEKFYKDVAIEVKIDGCRCICLKQNEQVQLFTRNGKLLTGFDEIEKQLKELPLDYIVFDGEIQGKDYTDTMNNLFTKKQGKKAVYNIFDTFTPEEFYSGESNDDYMFRKKAIEHMKQTVTLHPGKFTTLNFIVPLQLIANPTINELQYWTHKAVGMGYEGIMIKTLESKYKGKRTLDWQKMKPFQSDEFKIIGFEHGTGKNESVLGKVIVDVNGISVGVGSGFTDKERLDIWNNQDEYLGKIIEVQYQDKIKSSGSLRFPTVKAFRTDKE